MNISQALKSYFMIFAHLALGMLIIATIQQVSLPKWLSASVPIMLSFLVLNLVESFVLKLHNEVREFWSLRRTAYLPIGIACGGLIAFTPTALGFLTSQISPSDISFNTNFSLISIGVTLTIISWEELWFRGIFLNYSNRKLSSITLSVIMGFLFMVLHILNPKIDLLNAGPPLFFAGAFLTIVYFYFRTIWLPIGLHFGNNYMSSLVNTNSSAGALLGSEGYISTIVLAILFFVFVKLTMSKNRKTSIPLKNT